MQSTRKCDEDGRLPGGVCEVRVNAMKKARRNCFAFHCLKKFCPEIHLVI